MMKGSSSCAIYGIEDSQKCTAGYSVHCVRVCEGMYMSVVRTEVDLVWGTLSFSMALMKYNLTLCILHLNG